MGAAKLVEFIRNVVRISEFEVLLYVDQVLSCLLLNAIFQLWRYSCYVPRVAPLH